MPTSCVAVGCTNRYKRNNVSYRRFLKDEKRREKWISAIKRENWIAPKDARLCGAHFKSGKPSPDPSHPDNVPSIFVFKRRDVGNEQKQIERYKRAQKRRVKPQGGVEDRSQQSGDGGEG